jgi:hypothetical protein
VQHEDDNNTATRCAAHGRAYPPSLLTKVRAETEVSTDQASGRSLTPRARLVRMPLTALGPGGVDAAAGSAQRAAPGPVPALVPLAAPHLAAAQPARVVALVALQQHGSCA